MVLVIIVTIGVLSALVVVLLAVHRTRPELLRVKASLARVVTVEMEVRRPERRL